MILGVVILVFAALLLCMRGCVGSSEIENCVSVIFSLVELVLSIFMFIYMFKSDPGCGKELFVWGIVLLVFFCTSFLVDYIGPLVGYYSARGFW